MSVEPKSVSRIRVAFVIQNLHFGGMERVVRGLALHLPRPEFEVHVVVLQFLGRMAEGLEAEATLHQLPPMSKLSLLRPTALANALRHINPDIVHTHAGVWLKGVRAARLAGVRAIVHTEHGRPSPVPLVDRAIDNVASRFTDIILAVSEPLAQVLRQQVVADPSRVRIVANGVDVRRPLLRDEVGTVRRELGIPAESPIIGSIGRLEPIKNYGLALRAFRLLLDQVGDTIGPHLVLAGDGSERSALEALAEDLGVAAQVRFLGWRTDSDRLYSAFDLFTLTSRNEGTSISLLEAMSAGVCPVVTDVGGNRAVLGADLVSLLAPNDDHGALATLWRRLLHDGVRRVGLARQAQARVAEAYSLEHMVAEHATIYRALLTGGLTGRGSDR